MENEYDKIIEELSIKHNLPKFAIEEIVKSPFKHTHYCIINKDLTGVRHPFLGSFIVNKKGKNLKERLSQEKQKDA